MNRILRFGVHQVEITHEDKEYFPKNHITKADLIDYYFKIAPLMLPHTKDRLISMQRFPEGIDHEGFYQKNAGDYFPEWIKTKIIPNEDKKKVRYVAINNVETLLYLVNQGCITPHLWLSQIAHINKPDRMIFDLDPAGDVKFSRVRWAARQLKIILEEQQLTPFVMTTGSRGLHIIVPIKPQHNFDTVKDYAYGIAQLLVKEYPLYTTLEMSKAKRGDRIFLDIWRNGLGATGVAPYSVRALPGAPVATPFFWHELLKITPQKYTIKNIFRRIARVGNAWVDMDKSIRILKIK